MRKLVIVLLLSPICLLAQVNSVSPYTIFGLGDLSEGYFIKNLSMGGTSTALRDPLFINIANPASLTSLELTALDFGVTHKFLTQTDQNSGSSLKNTSTYFNYMGLGFKLTDWWGTTISMTPYSIIGYDISVESEEPDFGQSKFVFDGDGGITQIIFGNGFEVAKNLSVGVNARYLFGTQRKRESVEFADPTLLFSRHNEEVRVSDVIFDFGAQYELLLNRDKDDEAKNNLIIGATFGTKSEVNAKRSITYYTYVLNSGGSETPIDTTAYYGDVKGNLVLPSKYSIGVSYGGLSQLGTNSWVVTADYSSTHWSEYKSYTGESSLKNSTRISVGGCFTPLYAFRNGTSRRNYFKEIEWRFGGFHENTQISFGDEPVVVKGLSAGFNLPFKPKNLMVGDRKLNNFSFGIVYGTKSSSANVFIKEDFINLTFGLTFNDLWFQKRKYR